MKIIVPAGVGDFSWILSALYSVADEITEWQIVDGMPRRTASYVEIAHPGVPVSYVNIAYQNIRQFMSMNGLDGGTWEKVRALESNGACLDANFHLEAGKPLADWMPDLVPEYHYPLVTTPAAKKRARWLLHEHALPNHPMKDGPVVLFNAASHKGALAWHAWDLDTWVSCLKRVMAKGWRPVAVGGYWDDLTFSVCCELGLPSLVGKTDTEVWIEVLRLGDACINYSSGINVVRTVLEKPVLAFWPHHQNDLRGSWAPPLMKDEETYLSSLWLPLVEVWPVVKRHLEICERSLGRVVEGPAVDTPLEVASG